MHAARSLVPLSIVLIACGGSVVFEEDGGDGGGGGGAGVTVSSSGPSGGPTSSGGPVTTVGTGSGPSSATTTVGVSSGNVSTGVGGGGACSGNDTYVACLGAGDLCVPVFDDLCCSSCFRGNGCADCVDLRFVGCADRLPPEPGGTCVSTSCGFAPGWACEGEAPSCEQSGCFEAGCVQKLACGFDTCEVWCEGVEPDACGEVFCDAPPPACSGDQLPEVANGCWTGACMPAWVCQPQPPLF